MTLWVTLTAQATSLPLAAACARAAVSSRLDRVGRGPALKFVQVSFAGGERSRVSVALPAWRQVDDLDVSDAYSS